jgi:hypothetical protein
MRYLKMLGLATLATMILVALVANGASATTLDIGGAKQNGSVSIESSLSAGTSATLRQTNNDFVDTCTTSTVKGKTEGSYTGTAVGGKIALTFANCTHATKVVNGGTLSIEHTSGQNGTVRSSSALVTVQSTTFGTTLECVTSNTHLGTLTGTSSGHANLKINAVVNCGFFMTTAKWEGEYTVTSPTGLAVTA